MNQSKHAENMSRRFREIVEQAGDSLPEQHYDELVLIIESGLDAALIESLEKVAHRLEGMAHEIQHNVETET